MAVLTVEKPTTSGVASTLVAASAGGDSFANDGRVILRVQNGGASSITVTATATGQCNQGALHNATGSVSAGATNDFGPFPASQFNDGSGNVNVTYSAVTSVTVAAIRIG